MNQLMDKLAWRQLESHFQTFKNRTISDLFAADPERSEHCSIHVPSSCSIVASSAGSRKNKQSLDPAIKPRDDDAAMLWDDEAVKLRDEEAVKLRDDDAAMLWDDEALKLRDDDAAMLWDDEAVKLRDKEAVKLRDDDATMLRDDGAAKLQDVAATGLFCDFSRTHLDRETLSLLSDLADACDLRSATERLFSGDIVNVTEQRAAWHTMLRNPSKQTAEVTAVFSKMRVWADALRGKSYTDIVHVGMGGSHLGPAVVYDAFASISDPALRCHFITNENKRALDKKLSTLNPEKTLVIIVSKSFTTAETMLNAKHVLSWLHASTANVQEQLFATTADAHAAIQFGVLPDHIFPMWDWVGGRYSLWSAVSFSVAIAFGWGYFSALLSGAHAMDQHFISQPWTENLPVILALQGIWYRNFVKVQTQAIIPYHAALSLLPAHLQQLHMESLGKTVTQKGLPVNYETGAVIWGGVGPSSQHSFHQLLLQGNVCVPIDFVVTREDHLQYINCLAQATALMEGQNTTEPYRRIVGNRPSNMIVMDEITPFSIGALLAMYEHKVFVQSVIWDINAFDQWGVECGKRLAKEFCEHDTLRSSRSTIG